VHRKKASEKRLFSSQVCACPLWLDVLEVRLQVDLSRFEEVLLYRRGQSQRTGTLPACHFLLTAPQPLADVSAGTGSGDAIHVIPRPFFPAMGQSHRAAAANYRCASGFTG